VESHGITDLSAHFDSEIIIENLPFFFFFLPIIVWLLRNFGKKGEERGCDAEQARLLTALLNFPDNFIRLL